MKKLLLMLSLWAVVCSLAKAETEPNNTKAQANTLVLNGTVTGGISPGTDVDWFSVTTTGDGKLDFTITSSNSKNVEVIMYDNDGLTQLNAAVTAASSSFSNDGLAAGTYYLKVTTYYSGETPGYSISDVFTAASVANDAEPDSSRATALNLPLNGSKTGHVGYYFNGHRDAMDFYKVTTNGDGKLQIKLTSHNGKNVEAILYDNDAYTQLYSVVTAGSDYIKLDGLAAGTYYIQVNSYYGTDFEPYTISDSLFKPAQANDAEPDSSRATALNLPLNRSKTGHVGYYYNGHKDQQDFYKVTTNSDGWLRIKIASKNGRTIQAVLFDNDATTQLGAVATAGTDYINVYDLSAGTYYVRVNSYYAEFEPYVLTDSLNLFGVANDAEPDSTKATALTLAVDSNMEGHIGYYYKNHRDTTDFYKITLNQDGMLRLFLTSYNGNYMQAILYDNDGNTYINSVVTPGVGHVDIDGLGAGTYYIKINTYYSGQYAPYGLGDSLFTYSYANDDEPNDRPYLAKTIPANSMVTGHEDFYYEGDRNPIDYWKIYYTGTGNLNLVYNLEPHKSDGQTRYTSFQVYKDTTTGPISSVVTANLTYTDVLSSLTKGYYYIKVSTYYGNDFESYSIMPEFDQASVARIKATSYSTDADCSGNEIVFNCSGGHAPYTVYLDRFNQLYDIKVISGRNVTFKNLPGGYYTGIVYSDGASGAAFGKSKPVIMEPVVTGLNTTNITAGKATLKWAAVSCADYYSVKYQVQGTTKWITKKTKGNVMSLTLTGLDANTIYDWTVAAVDSENAVTATGLYADTISFITSSAVIAGSTSEEQNMSANALTALSVSPNPAVNMFFIHYSSSNTSEKLNAVLYNTDGKKVWSSGLLPAPALNGKQVIVTGLAKGVYYLKTMSENGAISMSTKVIISK